MNKATILERHGITACGAGAVTLSFVLPGEIDEKKGDVLLSRPGDPGGCDVLALSEMPAVEIDPGDAGRPVPLAPATLARDLSVLSERAAVDSPAARFSDRGVSMLNAAMAADPTSVDAVLFSQAALHRTGTDAVIDISGTAFVSYCRAEAVRHRIQAVDPSHVDGLGYVAAAEAIFSGVRSGVTPVSAPDAERELRKAMAGNPMMSRNAIGMLTGTRIEDMEMRLVRAPDLSKPSDVFGAAPLSGKWVDHFRETFSNAMERTGGSGQANLFSMMGRDVLVFGDTAALARGVAFTLSWPRSDRFAVVDVRGDRTFALSIEEVPDEAEIMRLENVADALEQDGPSRMARVG